MDATLVDFPVETPESSLSCANCPAVQRLERALEELRADFRREVGYWKSRHAAAVKRIEQLKAELDQSRAQTRALQGKLFGRKSEKSAPSDRSNDLFDPEEVAAAAKKRGAQPGHAGHGRRDYSHLPVEEEFVPLPEEALACPICGKPAAMMSATEDADVLGQLEQYDLDLPPGTVNDGLKRIEPLLRPSGHGGLSARFQPQP